MYTFKLSSKNRGFADFLFPSSFRLEELHVRQLLNRRLGHIKIQAKLLENSGSGFGPLPKEWMDLISDLGFSLDRRKSSIKWKAFILLLGVYGLFVSLREVFRSAYFRRDLPEKYVQLIGVSAKAIPNSEFENSDTIIDWYVNWVGRDRKVTQIWHSVKKHEYFERSKLGVVSQQYCLPVLPFRHAIMLSIFALLGLLIGMFDFLRGKWWTLFLLHEAVTARKICLIERERLAAEYLFSHEHCVYKPLWTFFAEKRGSRCSIFFYSTNNVTVSIVLA